MLWKSHRIFWQPFLKKCIKVCKKTKIPLMFIQRFRCLFVSMLLFIMIFYFSLFLLFDSINYVLSSFVNIVRLRYLYIFSCVALLQIFLMNICSFLTYILHQ